MSKWLKSATPITILVLLLSSVTGCSFRNLALKFADSLILIQIDRMFELTAEQEDYLEPKTEEFVEWFKKEKVPLFINELDYMEKSVLDGVSKEENTRFMTFVRTQLISIGQYLAPTAKTFLSSLSDSQIKHFSEYMTESNDRYVEVIESDDFVEKRSDDLRDRMETFYGDITDEQMAKIVKLTQTKDEVRTYLAQREVSQTFCLDLIVKGRKNPEKLDYLLKYLFEDPTYLRPESYREAYTELRQSWETRGMKIDSVLTSKQRKNLSLFVKNIKQDLKDWE